MYVRLLLSDVVQNLGGFIARVCFVLAAALLVYQALLWVEGQAVLIGTDFPVRLFLDPEGPVILWLNEPDSWLGLHRFLTLTPLPLMLFLVGWSLERLLR